MELRITSPTQDGFLKEIIYNHEEIKKELELRLEKYKGLTYSDSEIKLAKTDRATLNNFKKAITDKRIETKKQLLTPYEVFETKLKEILALIDKPVLEIDTQVKKFEDTEKENKKKDIEDFYSENIGDLKDILLLSSVWDDKWLNATVNIKNIQEIISTKIEAVNNDVKSIDLIDTKYHKEMKEAFYKNLSLGEALEVNTKLEQQEKKIEEYRLAAIAKKEAEEKLKLEQEEKAAQAEITRQEIDDKIASEVKAPAPVPVEVEPVQVETTTEVKLEEPVLYTPPKLEQIDFRVWVSEDQKKKLKDFLFINDIKYGNVE